jgi:hypothetical protein
MRMLTRPGFRFLPAVLMVFIGLATPARAAQLAVDVGEPRTLDAATLLARPDAATISVPMDVTYGREMTYRAVPLRTLLGIGALPPGKVLQLVASDGFVSTLPASLIFPAKGKGAIPFVAIEQPEAPWPLAPGGKTTGPFYLVWLDPAASGILQEQWPYNLAKLQLADSPDVRWPRIVVGDDAPADSPARKGQELVVSQCMVCHQLDGAGDAQIGPDLIRPHSPTEYLRRCAPSFAIRRPCAAGLTGACRLSRGRC